MVESSSSVHVPPKTWIFDPMTAALWPSRSPGIVVRPSGPGSMWGCERDMVSTSSICSGGHTTLPQSSSCFPNRTNRQVSTTETVWPSQGLRARPCGCACCHRIRARRCPQRRGVSQPHHSARWGGNAANELVPSHSSIATEVPSPTRRSRAPRRLATRAAAPTEGGRRATAGRTHAGIATQPGRQCKRLDQPWHDPVIPGRGPIKLPYAAQPYGALLEYSPPCHRGGERLARHSTREVSPRLHLQSAGAARPPQAAGGGLPRQAQAA